MRRSGPPPDDGVSGRRDRFESFRRFRHERDRLLAFLAERRIGGVVFLSGDRHLAELIRHDRDGLPPLWELTSSPLAAGLTSPGVRALVTPQRIAACVDQCNYGVVAWDPVAGALALAIHGEDGQEVFRQVVEIPR